MERHGTTPAGAVTGSAQIGGRTYVIWHGGESSASGVQWPYTAVVGQAAAPSGSVNVLGVLSWLAAHGYISGQATLTRVEFGWEISAARDAVFAMNRYSLTVVP